MRAILHLLRRIGDSPTLMTWGSFFVRVCSFLVLLPLVLRTLSTPEIVVFYLFNTVFSLLWLLEIGFGATFSRAVSYALAGAQSVAGSVKGEVRSGDGTANWELMGRIVGTMKSIYMLLAVVTFLLIASLGSWALARPVAATGGDNSVWLAWTLIVLAGPIQMRGNVYAYYLEGMNRVALVRRWDILFGLGSIASGMIALLLGGGLLSLVSVTVAWVLARVWRDRALCHRLDDGRFCSFRDGSSQRELLAVLWPKAWRSGLGGAMTFGVIYASSLLVGQIADTRSAAAYLLAMKLIESVAQFSMAPFYSQLPLLVRKRAEGDIAGLVSIARRGMILAHWTYITGFLFLALFADPLLTMIRSNAPFVSPDLWILIGLAFFIQRYGAMHVQLYSTTSHIISHTAEIASGVVFIVVSLVLLDQIGIYALPVGLICGYLGFYAWYVARASYRSLDTEFIRFEKFVLMPPMILFLAYAGLRTAIRMSQ